jgi:hypothetical protein
MGEKSKAASSGDAAVNQACRLILFCFSLIHRRLQRSFPAAHVLTGTPGYTSSVLLPVRARRQTDVMKCELWDDARGGLADADAEVG